MGHISNTARAGTVAVAICLVALAATGVAAASPPGDRPVHSSQAETLLHPTDIRSATPRTLDGSTTHAEIGADSSILAVAPSSGGKANGQGGGGPEGLPEQSASPRATTTTTTSSVPETTPATPSADGPTTSTTSTTQPSSPTANTGGSKPPPTAPDSVGAHGSTPSGQRMPEKVEVPASGAKARGNATHSRGAGPTRNDIEPTPRQDSNVTRRLDAERSFLTMALDSPVGVATLDGLDASDPTFGAASVVLSWLVDHEIGGGSMAVLSPFLVVLTIWDAASSAGSGVAAPASGLGTFVLIVLLDRSRLASKADLAGRPDDD